MNLENIFKQNVKASFEKYCNRKNIDQNIKTFLDYLHTHNFIDKTARKNLAVLVQYYKLEGKCKNQTEQVHKVASMFKINESTVRQIRNKKSVSFLKTTNNLVMACKKE